LGSRDQLLCTTVEKFCYSIRALLSEIHNAVDGGSHQLFALDDRRK